MIGYWYLHEAYHQFKCDVPKAFIGEIGVLKKRTVDTITTTRLREFVTEWVTGDTLANKLYETCQETNRNFIIGNSMCKRIHGILR
jgi:hypothetical protein